MPESYFATGYVRLLYRLLQAERLSRIKLFQGMDCSEADLMSAEYQMPFRAQMRFCGNALAHSLPGLGLRVGHNLQIAAHGALGTAVQSAPDLQTALVTFTELIAARASFYSLRLSVVERTACVEVVIRDLPEDLIPFFSESILFTIANCLSFYTGQHDESGRYQLSYKQPGYGVDYANALGGPVEFERAQTLISFDKEWLALSSPGADPGLYADSVQHCKSQISGRRLEDIAGGVEHFLLENPGKLWTVDEIGPLFAVSPRTLLRKLKAAGTSYQRLRDGILQRQAATYLSTMTVEATAITLGFADTSSFRRTYKRWFGCNPSEHSTRQACIAGSDRP